MKMQANRSNLSRRDFLASTAACAAAGIMGGGCMEQNRRAAKTLGVCGLDCAACPAFIARKTEDQALRVKTAAEWSKLYKTGLKPEDINCVGCLKAEGVHFGPCDGCEIRKCGQARKAKNCALCTDYPCEKIANFIANVPPAKANLDDVQRARQK
jgi:hypothetical protein